MKTRLSFLCLLLALNLHADEKQMVTPIKPVTDAEIRQKIVGTWVFEEDIKPEGHHKLIMTMSADGTTVSKTLVMLPTKTNEWNYSGKWSITNGICTTVLTKSSSNVKNIKADPIGSVARCKILTVDETTLVQQPGQQVMILKRKK